VFHLCAYTASIGPTADLDVAALTDDILSIQNSHFVLTQDMWLYAALAGSATLSRAKIASPTMRQIASPFIRPISVATLPGNNPNVALYYDNPWRIPWGEEIQMQVTSGVAMTERFTGLVWLGSSIDPVPRGNTIPLRWTSTTAAVANAWTSLTITFADTLPSGVYTIIGSECQSAAAIAHRWIISNQLFRPGMMSLSALSQRQPYAFGPGVLGAWGAFRSNDLPRVQVLCNGTDNAHEGYLHVIRTGNLS
jgi:hypothetical protein